jgi:hypothetical protein
VLRANKNKNIRDLYRGINKFKKSYQPRNILVMDENCDLLAHSHNILNKSKNYFPQHLDVYRVSDDSQIEMDTSGPLLHEASLFEIETAIANLKYYCQLFMAL